MPVKTKNGGWDGAGEKEREMGGQMALERMREKWEGKLFLHSSESE